MAKQIFNPYLPSYEYIPDGEPYVFGDRLYIYGSHDRFGGSTYCENDYVCYSAPLNDLSDWKFHGTIYKKEQHPVETKRPELFAPDVAQGLDGRYYLYYSMAHSSVISVAVCDEPAGKYEYLSDVHMSDGNVLGNKPGDYYQFDPAVLVDDDGSIYLYSGFCPGREVDEEGMLYAGCHVTKLDKDMITAISKPEIVISRYEYTDKDAIYFEAPSIRRINGMYYLVYSAKCTGLYYYYSQYPDRDFVYGGRIHSTSDVGINGYTVDSPAYPVGNTHGGIACINGQYYIFDHRLTNNSSFCRQGVAEPINIDKNGFIKQAESTSCGLNNSPLSGCGTYPAYIACNIIDNNIYVSKEEKIGKSLCITQDGPDREEGENQYITNFHDKCIVGFKYFDIEKISTIVMQVRGCAIGEITVSTDKNQLVKAGASEVNINSKKWVSVEIQVKIDAGKQALFFGYTGEGSLEFMELKLVNRER